MELTFEHLSDHLRGWLGYFGPADVRWMIQTPSIRQILIQGALNHELFIPYYYDCHNYSYQIYMDL